MLGGRVMRETVKTASASGTQDGCLALARCSDNPGMCRRSSASATRYYRPVNEFGVEDAGAGLLDSILGSEREVRSVRNWTRRLRYPKGCRSELV